MSNEISPIDSAPYPPSRWLAPLVLVLAAAIVFGDLLCGGVRVLSQAGEDLTGQFLGWRSFGFGQMRAGHFPLWNPHLFSGTPYFGGFQSALLYPINWVHLFLPLGTAINWEITLNILAAGLTAYAWARHRSLHPLACLITGLTYMFSGAVFMHIIPGHLANIAVMAWAPLVFLGIDGALEEAKLKWALIGGAGVTLQILGGHPQYLFYTTVGSAIYIVLNLVKRPVVASDPGAGIKSLTAPLQHVVICLAAIALCGASIAAVQLFTGVEAAAESARTKVDFAMASSISFPVENGITSIMPGFFGQGGSPYWGRWVFWETSIFVGLIPMILIIYGQNYARGNVRRFSLTMALIAFLLAAGSNTPLFTILYDFVPGFASFRAPAKFNFIVTLFLAMLAGVGFDELIKSKFIPIKGVYMLCLAAILFLSAGLAVHVSAADGTHGWWGNFLTGLPQGADRSFFAIKHDDEYLRQTAINVAWQLFKASLVCFGAAILWFFSRRHPAALVGFVLLAALELLVVARTSRPTFDLDDFNRRVAKISDGFKTLQKDSREYVAFGNIAMNLGGFDIWGDDPMVLRRYADFVASTQNVSIETVMQGQHDHDKFHRAVGLLRLRYMTNNAHQSLVVLPDLPTFPRAKLFTDWQIANGSADAMDRINDRTLDPLHTLVLEADPGISRTPFDAAGTFTINDVSPDEMDIDATLPAPAVMLITDNYSSGWRAEALPGSAQDDYNVMIADYTLRGIPLSAGTHHFRLIYRPTGFVVGGVVSCAAIVAYVLAWVWLGVEKSKMQRPLVSVSITSETTTGVPINSPADTP